MSEYMQGDPDKGGVAVPFSDDKSDADDTAELFGEDKPGEPPERRKERLQRRQERIQGMIQNGRRVKELEERDQQRERELAELRGRLDQAERTRTQPSANDQVDPYKVRLDAVLQRQKDAFTAAQAEAKAGTFTEERQRHYEQVAREIEEEKGTIFAQRVLAAQAPVQRAEQAQQQWISKYPEVYANRNAYTYAEGSFKRKLALLKPGEAPTNEMVDEVMRETMATFKIGPKPEPTRSERDRMSGLPASGGNGGGPPSITLTPAMRRMAIAAYDHLPEQEAIKAWVAKTGKSLRDKKIA